jgi:hypothetical protein
LQGPECRRLYGGRQPAHEDGINMKALIEQATGKPMPVISAATTTWRLKSLADAPIHCGDRILTVRRLPDHEGSWFEITSTPRA